jgi:hypothetical protein
MCVRAPALATSKIEQSGLYLITDESAELCGIIRAVSSTCTAADAGALRCTALCKIQSSDVELCKLSL